MALDIDKLRAATPGVSDAVYLNTGSCSLMPQPVIDAVQGHIALEVRIGGYRAMQQEAAARDAVYDSIAKLINAKPSEIALMGSNTLAWGSVFYGMQFREGDRILTSRSEYGANYVALLQMRKRTGCVIDVIPSDNTGMTCPSALEDMIDGKVKLIALNWIPTNGGLVNPAAEIGRVANRHGIPYLLDACQAVGQMPVDVQEIGCDYMTAAGRKWLRGPKGTGFLYVREERLEESEPALIDDIGAAWVAPDRYEFRGGARRFETHEHEPGLRLGLAAAAEHAMSIGIEAIRDTVRGLADGLRRELGDLPGITVQDLGSERSGLVTFSHDEVPAARITAALQENGIWIKTVPWNGALLDSTARDLGDLAHISAHYFNTESELAGCLGALRQEIGA